MKRVAFLIALAVLLTACSHDTGRTTTTVHLADPGRCTPVDVAAAPEIEPTLKSIAHDFNASDLSRFATDQCAFVRVHATESATAATRLVDGWTDSAELGPAPALWAPASSAWIALANQRLAARARPPIASTASSLGRTPLVIAMPAPVARALGWPAKSPGWRDLARVAANPLGWAAYGHPEWGAFRLGKANPTRATTGLLQTIAVSRLGDTRAERGVEGSVVYYGDAAGPYLDNWLRLDRLHQSLAYVSAVVADQRAVDAYNEGSTDGVVPPDDSGSHDRPAVPLVAIRPRDGALDSDNPLAPLSASWVSPEARAGATVFAAYARGPKAQAKALVAGLRPDGKAADIGSPVFGSVTRVLDHWSAVRKRARVLLMFDVSDSMGDPSDPHDPDSAAKIELAKRSAVASLSQLAPDDQVGLRIFTTQLGPRGDRNWTDVVPIGRLDRQRAALTRAIEALTPRHGSPLYGATRDSFDAMTSHYDPKRINGVVLLTDGHNEDDRYNDRAALLAHLHDPVRLFTISYSPDADLPSLRRIAQATNARVLDATDPETISDAFASAMASF